jgi:hypothetical protein
MDTQSDLDTTAHGTTGVSPVCISSALRRGSVAPPWRFRWRVTTTRTHFVEEATGEEPSKS